MIFQRPEFCSHHPHQTTHIHQLQEIRYLLVVPVGAYVHMPYTYTHMHK